MIDKIKEILKGINDKYAKSVKDESPAIFIVGENPDRIKPQFISTGIESVDKVLGGGIPKGCVTTIHGTAWAGKTAFCLTVAKQLTDQGKYVLYVNLEGIKLDAYDFILGKDNQYLIQLEPRLTGEHIIEDVEELLYDKSTKQPKGLIDLIIIDSINNLHTDAKEKAWQEGPEKIPQMGSLARLLNDFLTRLYGKGMLRNGTSMMLIAQDRANIAGASLPMAPKTIMSGGESLKFNGKLTVKISRKINLAKTGQTVMFDVEKNSMTGLLGKAEFDVIYGKGIDDSQALMDKAKEFGYLIPSDKKGTNILILPGLGDLELSAVKADKALGTKAVSISSVILNTIKENPEIAHCLRIALSGKKPAIGQKQGYSYTLNEVVSEEVNDTESNE